MKNKKYKITPIVEFDNIEQEALLYVLGGSSNPNVSGSVCICNAPLDYTCDEEVCSYYTCPPKYCDIYCQSNSSCQCYPKQLILPCSPHSCQILYSPVQP